MVTKTSSQTNFFIITMNKNQTYRVIGLTGLCLCFYAASLCAQEAPPLEKKPTRQQLALSKAEINLSKIEKKIATADSLEAIGYLEYGIAHDSIESNNEQRKTIDKEYLALRKPLNKKIGSKDRATATLARAELKKIDAEYSAAVKASDAQWRDYWRVADNAQRKVTKGQKTKKDNSPKLKQAKKALTKARKNLDITSR